MKYSIKEMAELSGVSRRTLRYYDEIKLLKPMGYSANGYRYYGEKELLLLQQILFFRHFGFKLSSIVRIISSSDFDKIEALETHKRQLVKQLSQTQNLVNTIDKTIKHLRGEIKMKDIDLFLAFQHPSQLEMVEYIHQQMGQSGDKIIKNCKEKIKNMTAEDFYDMEEENKFFADKFRELIENDVRPSDKKAQKLIKAYYERRIKPFYLPTDEELIRLVELDINHPNGIKKYQHVHPKLAQFFLDGIKYFVKEKV